MVSITTRTLNALSEEAIQGYYEGMRPFWYPVLRSEDLPESRPVSVELLSEELVLARLNGSVVALQDLCRHFQARRWARW